MFINYRQICTHPSLKIRILSAGLPKKEAGMRNSSLRTMRREESFVEKKESPGNKEERMTGLQEGFGRKEEEMRSLSLKISGVKEGLTENEEGTARKEESLAKSKEGRHRFFVNHSPQQTKPTRKSIVKFTHLIRFP